MEGKKRTAKNSVAKVRANTRYTHNHYDEIKVRVPKGQKKVITEFAKSKGKSVNRFISDAIIRAMIEESDLDDLTYLDY